MKATIFDLDGTLLQSMAKDCEIFEYSIQHVLGPVQFREKYSDYDNVTDRGIVEQLIVDNGIAVEPGVVESIRNHFVSELGRHIETVGPFAHIHGALNFVDWLRTACDASVAIATGCWRDSAILKLGSSGFDLTSLPLATCDDSPSRTAIMQIALAKLGGNFDSVTYFGDAEWDERASRELGWKFVPVGPGLNGIDSYDNVEL